MRLRSLLAATALVATGLAVHPVTATACTPLVVDDAGDTTYEGGVPKPSVVPTNPRADILGVDLYADATRVYAMLHVSSLSAGTVPALEAYDYYRVSFDIGTQAYDLQVRTTSPPVFEYVKRGEHPHKTRGGIYTDNDEIEIIGAITSTPVAPGDLVTNVTAVASAIRDVPPTTLQVYENDATTWGTYVAGTAPCLPIRRPR